MPSDMAESMLFDVNLLQKGVWSKDERKLIEEWIKEDSFDDKRVKAANLLSVLIPRVLGDDCSTAGKVKSKRLGETLHYFEDLLITTKAGIAKKFYRDHLNHMLRVMLLSSAICEQVQCFIDLKNEVGLVKLASLVHDIAYPIAESYHIIGDTIKSMSKCYESLTFPEFSVIFCSDKVNQFSSLLGVVALPHETLTSLQKKSDHGLVGAIELMEYINPNRLAKYYRVFQAIAYHNSTQQIPSEIRTDLLIKLLVLSDELEDWGRPIGIEKESVMPAITDFNLTAQGIQGKWIWKDYKEISPLRQIYSKFENLGPICWPRVLELDIEFVLPKYKKIKAVQIERITNKLIEYCSLNKKDCMVAFSSACKNNKELLRMFYGDDFPADIDLIEFSFKHPFEQEQLFCYDSEGKELFLSCTKLNDVKEIKLSIDCGQIALSFFNENGCSKGLLFKQDDSASKQVLQALLAKIAICHGLASRMYESSSTVLYPYPSKESVDSALRLIGEEDQEFGEALRIFRKCIYDKGFFIFAPKE
jgi:hypothetical protein